MNQQHLHQLRSPTPITEEADEDDDSSSAYGRTIRRIIQRSGGALGNDQARLSFPLVRSASMSRLSMTDGSQAGQYAHHPSIAIDQDSISLEMSQYFSQYEHETRSLYSLNESEFDSPQVINLLHQRLHSQFETSFTNSIDQSEQHPNPNPYSDADFSPPRRGTLLRRNVNTLRGFNSSNIGGESDSQYSPSPLIAPRVAKHRRSQFPSSRLSVDADQTSSSGRNGFGSGAGLGPGNDLQSDPQSSEADLETKWSWKNLRREFKLSHSESLFHLYQAKLQQSFFVALLILNIIFNVGAIVSYSISKFHEINIYLIFMRLASIWVFVSFLVLIWFNKLWMQSKFSRTVASLAVLLAMIFGEASGAVCALINDQATPLASIRRTYYLIITNHVFLPYPNRIQSCAATIIITSFEIIVTYISRRDNNCRADYLTLYSIADIIFYASSAMIGFQITFLLEIAIRRTFLNHKYCIQSTYKLNYEKEQQEQLLRSCLPQHLIEEVRGDIRELIVRVSKRQSEPFRPFKHLYVKKYEDVTILYADIVNSMNLTDKLNPPELVETLNELYGRFDELAEKYSCLRIKLLGDCYYCVSGLPEYDEDHAMKSLLMGLGMIKIIQCIKRSRNVDIGMRIGIHSGSVLSGLLGLRKWQFDIWSLDAMKASQMEHSGQPGFVHITQKTLDLISKDQLEQHNLIITSTRQSDDSETTYLISERICNIERELESRESPKGRRNGQSEKLKACIEKLRVRPTANAMDFTQRRMVLESSLKKYREIHEKVDETMKTAIAEMPLGSAWKQFFFIDCLRLGELLCRRSPSSSSSRSCSRKSNQSGGSVTKLNWHSDKNHSDCQGKYQPRSEGSCCSSSARDLEQAPIRQQEPPAKKSPARHSSTSKRRSSSIGHSVGKQSTKGKKGDKTAVRSPSNKALIQTDPLFHLYLICVGLITLSILAIKCLIPGMPIYTHTVIGFGFLLVIILVSTIYTQVKSKKINLQFRVLLWLIISASLTMLQLVDLIVPDELDSLNDASISDITRADSLSCAFAWYYTFTIIVAMTATSIFIRINVWLKFMIHMSTIVFYIIINNPPATMMDTLREFLATQNNNWSILDHKQELSHLFYITMIAVILHLIDRQVEYILSLNIQWNEQLERDRIESETVGQINKMLLENILPPHVLKRYLYNTTVSYDQLYHESHPSCAVMFASIPNYEQFYTETKLNGRGLKCLQVLNEIICDFDQLLSHPYFRSIEKIKTIGSTYMAACFDVTRRTSDCTIHMIETPQTPDIGSKAAWSSPFTMSGSSGNQGTPSVCPSPRIPSDMGSGHIHLKLNESRDKRSSLHVDEVTKNNVVTMVRFAMALMENLELDMNKHAWQDFRLRIGIATGPVIAGVVGATKPTYDIWGDTVNVASRLESSGVLGRIQVSEQVAQILCRTDDFEVECRGPIEVKGKGLLTTYLVRTPYDSNDSDLSDRIYDSEDSRQLLANGDEQELMSPPDVVADDEVEELCLNREDL